MAPTQLSATSKPPNTGSTSVKHMDPESKKKPPIKPPSTEMPFLAKSAAEGPFGELATTANRLFQEAKLQLEQSGNIKSTIKETVIECISSLYTIVLRLNGGTPPPATQTVTATAADFAREVLEELQQHRQLVVAARADIGAVKEQVQKIDNNIEKMNIVTDVHDRITYAAMAATTRPAGAASQLPQPVHSMVVSSVDSHDTSEDIIDKIRTAVSAKTSGVRVDRLRKARDQKVVLGYQSREELTRVVEKLKAGSPTLLTQ
ncbi:uncharacterized protein LOC123870069 [Maniola jurtina]|uniref:uncharacterized protein LOC123870069 n=1 Tax=Maniola jurtina TaxID=191418 RepID=UPI001E68C692|nr:uncharacterized protein LOC123870069 [Maniola jurtina]